MYAVIKTGGKQYRVTEGDVVNIEKLVGEPGSKIELSEVLAVGEGEGIKIGTPLVEGARVVAEILAQDKGKKVIIYKKKRRKGYDKRQGHRQFFTSIKIQEIKA